MCTISCTLRYGEIKFAGGTLVLLYDHVHRVVRKISASPRPCRAAPYAVGLPPQGIGSYRLGTQFTRSIPSKELTVELYLGILGVLVSHFLSTPSWLVCLSARLLVCSSARLLPPPPPPRELRGILRDFVEFRGIAGHYQ